MAVKLGEASREILKWYRENLKDTTLTEEDAKSILGADKAVTVGEMTDTQLLQFALLTTWWDVQTLRKTLEEAVAANQALQRGSLNREQRRAFDRKR